MDSKLLHDRESARRKANHADLIECLSRAVPTDGAYQPHPSLRVYRSSIPTEPVAVVQEPSFCIIAQGSKEIFLESSSYRYDPAHYLLSLVQLPITARIVDATAREPYLSLRLGLDTALISDVILEAGENEGDANCDPNAIEVSQLDNGLLDAVTRLVRSFSDPTECRILTPLIMREIIYRLLKGEQGKRLRHFIVQGGRAQRITRVIELLRRNFDQVLRIDQLAREVGMSVSSLHHHFKAVTKMSPLQFQKKLRLHEARRLMLGANFEAAQAGFQVGYEDASHFSRDYKKMFGSPPLRDVEQLREAVSA